MTIWRIFGWAAWALALVAIFTFAANAKPIAIAGEGGDTITLHDTPCELKGWQKAEYRYASGKLLNGCWNPMGSVVVTVWEDGDTLPIPPQAFKPVTGV